ncbi:MAG TPA: aminotransferase class I/II-fold pyridoxal phosphate-dependent enzyme, partial [Planctomycetota bacterium]|nr:aminotransferase class I/II-fold pyridoxal phosphate-dependent enzyme [Planctomycetota bacterium]
MDLGATLIVRCSRRIDALPPYAFAELDRLRDERAAQGADVIDFGVGDPTDPTPDFVVEAAVESLRSDRCSGYPSYIGGAAFRTAVAAWIGRRYGVRLDPATGVSATVGSKEAIFHAAEAFVDPGDWVLAPSPGYPPYVRGAQFAEGRCETYAVATSGPVLPDLEALPDEVGERLRLVWITQPHVPTGRAASLPELSRLLAQVRERSLLLCSDEAYSELWLEGPAPSALQAGVENVLVFQSLSKRAAMTGYRVGFVAGDPRAVAAFRRLKTNIDSGTPNFVQAAAIAALADDGEPAAARERYRARAEVMVAALRAIGCTVELPGAGFYLWAATPRGESGVEFARRMLLGPALAVMPGEWLAEPLRTSACVTSDLPHVQRSTADLNRAWGSRKSLIRGQ